MEQVQIVRPMLYDTFINHYNSNIDLIFFFKYINNFSILWHLYLVIQI